MSGPSFSDMREQNLFTNAIIKSNSGLEWNVHKVVMSQLGMFVCRAFSKPDFDGTLNMSVSDEVCQIIIDLAYKGKCDINHETVLETLEAAMMYQLESLVQLCIAFILENMISLEHFISVKTFLRIQKEGVKAFTDGALIEVVDKWIRKNFNDVCETEDIYELSSEELESYVKEDDLNIPEEDLLEFLLKYATRKNLNSEETTRLLANVRQSLINVSKVSQIVEKNQALRLETEKAMDIQRIKNPRLPRDVVIVFRKQINKNFAVFRKQMNKNFAEIFNIRKDEWKTIENCSLRDLPSLESCNYGLSQMGNVLYYFGDSNVTHVEGGRNWRALKAIDLKDGRSFDVERLNLPDYIDEDDVLYNLHHIAWNGRIVVLVGPNFGTVFDPKENKWSEFPTCQTSNEATLVTIDGNLFAIGGVNEIGNEIGSIEYYDSKNSEWVVCGSLKIIRGVTVAAGVDGKVYVFTIAGEEQDGECFQPVLENGRMSLIWHPSVKPPWKYREDWQVSVVDNKLVFIGGTDFHENSHTGKFVRESHIFSPRTGEWSRASDMNAESFLNMAVTVDTSYLESDRIEELCSGKFLNSKK